MESTNESYLVIWTTTPWTLPANLAIAVHPRETYIEVITSQKTYWVAEALCDNFISACGIEDFQKGQSVVGDELVSR